MAARRPVSVLWKNVNGIMRASANMTIAINAPAQRDVKQRPLVEAPPQCVPSGHRGSAEPPHGYDLFESETRQCGQQGRGAKPIM